MNIKDNHLISSPSQTGIVRREYLHLLKFASKYLLNYGWLTFTLLNYLTKTTFMVINKRKFI